MKTDALIVRNKQTGTAETIAMREITFKDWGFSFLVDSELEAFKAAYEYRKNKHGLKVEFAGGVGSWMVTIYNETGAKLFNG